MISSIRILCVLFVLSACTAAIEVNADTSNQTEQNGIGQQKIIAIGDIHGDFDQFVKLMRSLKLINKRNRWTGGQTHLVQMGDIPDRGPDSRKVMDLLMKLEKAAAKKGGAVTVLIGNHEAMMMTNDLRYVHPGEYASFKDKNSKARRDAYYQQTVDHIKNISEPDSLPVFDKAYRDAWNARFPLGYVEHRVAWSPAGEYGKWVLSHQAVAKVGDSLFAHGGLSNEFSASAISDLNTRVRTELADPSSVNPNSVVESEAGPLWYRGWASLSQTADNEVLLDRVLAAYGVKRMVVAHTPLLPIVLPRFSGKLLMVDVGLSKHYGGGMAALEIESTVATAIIQGERLALPTNQAGINKYLDAAQLLIIDDGRIDKYQAAVEKARQAALLAPNADAVPAVKSLEN